MSINNDCRHSITIYVLYKLYSLKKNMEKIHEKQISNEWKNNKHTIL